MKVEQPVLEGFKRVGFRFFPICMNLDSMKKKKFKEFFDVGIIGFSHTAYLQQGIRFLIETLRSFLRPMHGFTFRPHVS